jgi:hypothetical protein
MNDEPTQANQLRALLAKLYLSQRGAAKLLDIDERTMRRYCAGDRVPRVVFLALERLMDMESCPHCASRK